MFPITVEDVVGNIIIGNTKPLTTVNAIDEENRLVTFSIKRNTVDTYQLIYVSEGLNLNLNYQIKQVPDDVPSITLLDPTGKTTLARGDLIIFDAIRGVQSNQFTSNIKAIVVIPSQYGGITYLQQFFIQNVTLTQSDNDVVTTIETTLSGVANVVFSESQPGCGPRIEATVKNDRIEVSVTDIGYTYELEGDKLIVTSYDCTTKDSFFIMPLPIANINLEEYVLSLFVYGKIVNVSKTDFKNRLLLSPFRDFSK